MSQSKVGVGGNRVINTIVAQEESDPSGQAGKVVEFSQCLRT
ncbi:hypothetical protein ES703_77433 [subsurface metagenome]